MSLFAAIFVSGCFLLCIGALFASGIPLVQNSCKAFPRHKLAGYCLFGLGALWFLWNVSNLTKADEIGFVSNDTLLIVFAFIALLTVPFVPDFLAVRGLAILYLLAARVLLDLGWMEYSTPQRLFNTAIYLGIVAALIIGASPYRLRDFFNWSFARPARYKLLGSLCALYGLTLTLTSLSL